MRIKKDNCEWLFVWMLFVNKLNNNDEECLRVPYAPFFHPKLVGLMLLPFFWKKNFHTLISDIRTHTRLFSSFWVANFTLHGYLIV